MLNQGPISVSLNEVEQISLKAARGAGAAWGVAEDVARATRWMAERGLDWSVPLRRLLASGTVADHLRPVFEVADLLPGVGAGDRSSIGGCAPVWGLAILSAALHGRPTTVDLAWTGGLARLQTAGVTSSDRPLRDLDLFVPHQVTVKAQAATLPLAYVTAATTRRSAVGSVVWREFADYAARTTVAPSSRSRATGAGGGRVDDD